MKYNDYIILTDEDYNNMKSKYHHLDEIDREKLLDIYDHMLVEYKELDGSSGRIVELSRSQISDFEHMLSDAGIDYSGRSVVESSVDAPKTPYYNPLRRLFMLGRPMPPPHYPPYRRGLDIVDLMLLYIMLRPHSRFVPNICNMAHERVECLRVGE